MSDLKEFVNDKLNENEKTRRADYEALDKKGDKQFDEMKTLLQEAQNQNSKQIDSLQVNFPICSFNIGALFNSKAMC